MQTRSIARIRSDFCDLWRKRKTDEEFLAFVRLLVSLEGQDPRHHKEAVRAMLSYKAGDIIYLIADDEKVKLTQ